MERRNYNKNTMTELTVAGGTTTSNDDDILEEIRGFYENLYERGVGREQNCQNYRRTKGTSSKEN